MQSNNYRTITRCRICNSASLEPYLDLGMMPLVNHYIEASDRTDQRYPLLVLFCKNCSLSQLSTVVDPGDLFRNYSYRSSVSDTFKDHCEALANSVADKISLVTTDLVVDIASNDGCLIEVFKTRGVNVLGIDPAKNLVDIANRRGLNSIDRFWNIETAKDVVAKFGTAKVITATNVLAHVDNLHNFIEAVKILLHDDGLFLIEVPYLVSFMNKKEFDTVYHEHLSYFLLKPLKLLLHHHDMVILDIQQSVIHGGTIRVFAKKAADGTENTPREVTSVEWLIDLENDLGLNDFSRYKEFQADVELLRHDIVSLLKNLKKNNKTIAAYGASAKGCILLNFCNIGRETIEYVVDDTPEKLHKLTPGTKIPIVSREAIRDNKTDYLLLLAWNFTEELIQKTEDYRMSGGRYIIPIPMLKIL